jgi:POT family proton-dependent oligopeptide transporter
MVLGFILTGATMALRALAAFVAGDAKVSILWEVGAFFLITCAEVCISPVGLELAFLAAPKAMKGFVTACFLLTVAGGDIINTRITRLYEPFGPTYYFAMETLIMVPVTIAFIFVAHRFNRASERWTRSEVGAPTIPAVAPVPPEA